jgi:Phosphotransferase enzyme family
MTVKSKASIEGDARNVLARYWGEIAVRSVFFRGIRGGFSGSRVFEVKDEFETSFFLKQWPSVGPDRERLRSIHRLIEHLHRLKKSHPDLHLPSVAYPIRNQLGNAITSQAGRLWDLSPKVPGTSRGPGEVTSEQVSQAMQSIAKTHLAMSFFSSQLRADFPNSGSLAPSPGLLKRRQKATAIIANAISLKAAITSFTGLQDLKSKCELLFDRALPEVGELVRENGWEQARLPIQLCLSDLWFAHVLFDESQVTGIIDFGSIREDCVATDLARLLGSWFAPANTEHSLALDAYSAIRPLSEAERLSFHWFDRTSRLLSAFQWIEWLVIEKREFDDWEAVSQRLDFVLARLPSTR